MRALQQIRQLDYTILFARDLPAMRRFYAEVLGFPVVRSLGPQWTEHQVGSNLLVLTERGMMFDDPATPAGALSVQLAFRVAPAVVAECAEELRAAGVKLEQEVTDQPWGHRTLFFRDPDGNVLEIYADL
ncbi:MAG TPA: VOC family protein [Gemmatimonadales bacterium]|nr:VOC family protein [Gemmatimonadales bacterium]